MRRALAVLFAFTAALLSCQPVEAGFIFSLSSSADLNSLAVGDQATISVDLSGLDSGDTIDFLATQVNFDSSLFSFTPGSLLPGSIIPAGSLDGFGGGDGPDFVGGVFDTIFAATPIPITLNGSFFTFSLTAIAAGNASGAVAFSTDPFETSVFGTTAAGDPVFEFEALGDPLGASVTGSVVPEPTSMALYGFGALGIACVRRLRRRSSSI